MLIRGITIAQAEEIAKSLGVSLYNTNRKGTGFTTVLRPSEQFPDKYRKYNDNMGRHRKCWAVCWHGHRDFMRAIFRINPNAVIRTAVENYYGAEEFEKKYQDTGYKNVASQATPVWFAESCECGEGVR